MTSIPGQHFQETRDLVSKLSEVSVAQWLLRDGYFPEQYVLPPCFHVSNYSLENEPYFSVEINNNKHKLEAPISELESISLPKSTLTVRDFSIIDPRHYHDMVFYVVKEWKALINHLFHEDIDIYSYSFPIPISKNNPGSVGQIRAGRMIYEFIEMAERDLVSEAHRYKFILKSDITNFYSSIYTHSIAWALQGKIDARRNRNSIDTLGKKLDRLAQRSNDGCTNGIAVGPAISDLISEILLAAIDKDISQSLRKKGIDFLGVRFKDDYRFLCQTENDARNIISTLQQEMRNYNLIISESKSETLTLPEGLFRPWKSLYNPLSLRNKSKILYKLFESTFQSVLAIDSQNPGTGIIDSFLSELTSRKQKLKLHLGSKERGRIINLLLMLREKRQKSFPMVLAIIEAMLNKYPRDEKLAEYVRETIKQMLKDKADSPEENQYEIVWLIYFIRTVLRENINFKIETQNPFIKSLLTEKQQFYSDFDDGYFFELPQHSVSNNHLLNHLAIFRAKQVEEDNDTH